MAKEIERKFLVDKNHPELKALLASTPHVIRQGYLKSDHAGVVRVRILDETGYLTVKSPTRGITRDEFEYEIPKADAEVMLQTMCNAVIEKQRYIHPLEGGLKIEVDVFSQIDLIVAEIELPDETCGFLPPDWLLREVSDDPGYYNSAIAERLAELA